MHFSGIGYASALICFLLNIYYIVVMAWAVHYFFSSFTSELPWSHCRNEWNTESCFDPTTPKIETFSNGTIVNASLSKSSVVEYWE